ncbi:MFS transporter [Polymorphobacter sp.]|uniref:MFS transporter n=1 Tax=Polymorphobacter sp. TaxID=1909290 RepID=UPI003F6FA8A7
MTSQVQPVAAPAREAVYPPTSLCLGYAVGTAGVAILLNTIAVYFPALMSTVLGISPAVAATMIMFSKFYDAFANVVTGALSDRTKSRLGRRRPFLLAGGLVSSLSLLMIFVAPPLSGTTLIVYMAVALVLYSTGYSLFNVPYLAMPAEITRGTKERLRLISFRTAFVGVGQLTALALSAWLIDRGGGGNDGYRLMGVVMASLALVTMVGSFLGTASARVEQHTGAAQKFSKADVRSLLANRPLRLLLGAKLAQYCSFGILSPVTLFFMLNVMSVGYTGMIHQSVVQNSMVFLSQPVWTRIGTRFGKRNAYLLAQAIMIPAVVSWWWADATTGLDGIWWRAAMFGFASGGALLMSTSMLPDTIEYDRLTTGIERGGVFASLYSVNEKLGFAVGAAVLGMGLSFGGYVATTGGKIIAQSAETVTAIYLIKCVVPAAFLLIGVLLLLRYRLDDATLARLRAEKQAQA